MKWLTKILGRDDSAARIADARAQRADAAHELELTREVTSRLHKHGEQNNFTKRMAAAFAAHERREGRA
jgi:hypothetical protein